MVPGTLGHGPLRLSGPWDMVLGPCPFRLLGPWDLVPYLCLRERIALMFKSSNACAQDVSRRIFRQVRIRATECGCVQRFFEAVYLPSSTALLSAKHGREIEGF